MHKGGWNGVVIKNFGESVFVHGLERGLKFHIEPIDALGLSKSLRKGVRELKFTSDG